MRYRPTLRDLTAGVLVVVAVLIWSIWISREVRRPRPVAAVAAPAVPVRNEAPPPLERTPPDVLLESVRAELKQNPADSAPLGRLAAVRGDEAGDAILAFAAPGYSKDVRVEALRLMSERGFTEGQLRKLMAIYDTESDDEIQVLILLGVQKAAPAAADPFVRKGIADVNDAVRGVAVSGLDPAREEDRIALIKLAASDAGEQVRGSAAIQLQERIGDRGVLEALMAMALQDESAENRMVAVGALRHDSLRGDARVRAHLERVAAQDRSADVRIRAQAVLDGLTRRNN